MDQLVDSSFLQNKYRAVLNFGQMKFLLKI
jgi:hypothetical protein